MCALIEQNAATIEAQAVSIASLQEQARRDREYSSSQARQHAKLVNRVLTAEARAEKLDKNCTEMASRALSAEAQHKSAVSVAEVWQSRAEQAERALAALAPVRDMLVLCGELGGMAKEETPSDYLRRLIDEASRGQRALAGAVEVMRAITDPSIDGALIALSDPFEAARAFVAQHGSDSKGE
jgi:hypothetical protein